MGFNQESSGITSLSLETSSQPVPAFGGFPAPILNGSPGYSPETGNFYPPPSQIFSASPVDPRSRLASHNTSTVMAHTPRTATLPNLVHEARDIYGGSRPSYMRPTGHISRSPSFAAPLRGHPLSPTPSPSMSFNTPVRMEGVHPYSKTSVGSTPPLLALTTLGQLYYIDGANHLSSKVEIHGCIDKGFFLSDGDWTCYRRNYFSCICSYSMTPHFPNSTLQFIPLGSTTPLQVFGFAMSISAVVSDSDSQTIDLVQHTPKRDKGPTEKPGKVRMLPKPQQQGSHPLYQDHHTLPGTSRPMYEGGYNQSPPGPYATDHTFERIQFKQATANNGKRRAAQQYYHLVIELWADVGSQTQGEQFIKVAERKSAKMIVRGRSPGHYQNERRGSTSSGPGGSGNMGSYPPSHIIGSEYGASSTAHVPPGTYTSGYEPRSGHYTTTRHPDIGVDSMIRPEESKMMESSKTPYTYYPSTIFEGVEPRSGGVEMFSHRHEQDTMMTGTSSAIDSAMSKVKPEYEHSSPSIYHPGQGYYSMRNCGRFEGKPTSNGYYPAPLSQSG